MTTEVTTFSIQEMRDLWKREAKNTLRSRNLNSKSFSSHTTPLAVAINAAFYNWINLVNTKEDHLVLRIQREPRLTLKDTFTFVFWMIGLYFKGLYAARTSNRSRRS